MNTRFVAALLVALSTSVAVPAFASGYGPAPFYQPAVDAPASQMTDSSTTARTDSSGTADAQRAYGGVAAGSSESSRFETGTRRGGLFAHH